MSAVCARCVSVEPVVMAGNVVVAASLRRHVRKVWGAGVGKGCRAEEPPEIASVVGRRPNSQRAAAAVQCGAGR